MAEGLEFLLELDAKLDGALGMVRALRQSDDALHRVDAALRKVEQATGHASAGHEKHAKHAEHLHGVLDRLTHAGLEPFLHKAKEIAEFEFIRRGADALIELPFKLAEGVADLGKEMIKAAAHGETLDKSFKLLFGEKEGKENLEWLEHISKFTQFTGAENKQLALALGKVGFKGEGLGRARAAAGDVAALTGGGFGEAQSAVAALDMMKRTGRVNDRILKPLGVGEKDFFKALSERTGLGIESIKARIEKGTFDTEDALETFYTLLHKKTKKLLGGADVEMSRTLESRLHHLGAVPEEIFEKFKDTKGYDKLSEAVGKIFDAFDPNGVNGEKIIAGMDAIGEKIGNVFDSIDFDKVLGKASDILDKLPAQIDDVTQAFSGMSIVINDIVKGVRFFADVTEKTVTLAEKVMAPEVHQMIQGYKDKAAGKADTSILGRLETPGGTLEKILGAPDKASQWLSHKLFGAGEDATGGFLKGLNKGAPLISDATGKLGDVASGGIQDKLEIHSPSRVFEKIGEMTGRGFNQGLDKSMNLPDSVAHGAFAIPSSIPAIAAGRAPITISIGDINVSAPGADGQQIAQQVSDTIREILPGQLQSAFEHIQSHSGS